MYIFAISHEKFNWLINNVIIIIFIINVMIIYIAPSRVCAGFAKVGAE